MPTPFRLLLSILAFASAVYAQGSSVVISQLYGGGGNAGARLRNDFIELFNGTSIPADLNGWTLQYSAASSSTWDTALLSGTIQPGRYYLIQLSPGSGGTDALPAAELAAGINLSSTGGKVALVRDRNAPTATAGNIADLVGYGDANLSEGRPAPSPGNTLALIRLAAGCTDTGDNRADFATAQPAPRNSLAPSSPCTGPAPQISAGGVTNAASFRSGPVSPGELITIFGSGIGPQTPAGARQTSDGQFLTKALGGTRVLFNGISAAMIYASASQVNAVVPYGVATAATTQLQVEVDGRLSNPVTLDVVSTTPAVFTQESSARGAGAILNQDGKTNSTTTPAAAGSVIAIYATGGGQTIPAGEDARIVSTPGRQSADVSVRIGGLAAEVLYAGPAPGLVSGVLQVNARLPQTLEPGNQSVEVAFGTSRSPAGIVATIAGLVREPGTGSAIDTRLHQLRQERTVPVIPEITSDRDPVPADWLGLVSWNIQVGGTTTAPGSPRPAMVRTALNSLFSGTYGMLSAQEIPSADSAAVLQTLLPATGPAWTTAFTDTTDSMDNGVWTRTAIVVDNNTPLFTTGMQDTSGRPVADETRAVHPPVLAHVIADDFDFTFIGLHLTFADGNTSESIRELANVKEYLDSYFRLPLHDPDVVICGDFNTPSLLSGQTGRSGITLDDVFGADPRFQTGERRFAVTIHEGTSRSPGSGAPASNYDHCLISADALEEFVQARRVDTTLLTNDPEDPEQRLTSDHFPVVAFFRTRGPGIALDLSKSVGPGNGGTVLRTQ